MFSLCLCGAEGDDGVICAGTLSQLCCRCQAEVKLQQFATVIVPRSNVFSGPHTEMVSVCCAVAAQPFQDRLLLHHISINVNVFWFVKCVQGET